MDHILPFITTMHATPKPQLNIKRPGHANQPPPTHSLKLFTPEELDSLILPSFTPDTDMGKLLRSQLSPTEGEKARFQALQLDILRQAASLDSLAAWRDSKITELSKEIERLRLEATKLRERSKEALHAHHQLQALFAPIRTLPPEIMGEIFLECLGPTVFARTCDAPLLLGRVCSAWRAIALSTPQLWATLTFRKSDFQALVSTSIKWFSRAGNLPLSIQLHMESFYQILIHLTRSDPFIPPSQWSRLHNLEVDLRSGKMTTALLNVLSGAALANVERLSISESNEPTRVILSNLPAMPKLRKLLVSDMVWFHGAWRHLPWKQLTHLNSTGYKMHPADWCSLIRECISLQHGSFTLVMGPSPQENTGIHTKVTLPYLLSLKVVFAAKGGWSILSGLTFPSLLSMTLGTNCPDYGSFSAKEDGLSLWHPPAFAQIDAHSLETLVLFNVSIREESLIAFLRTTPKLKSFTGDFPFEYGPLFEQLSLIPDETRSNENFLPNLTKVSIYQLSLPFNVAFLADMVKSRWYPRHSVRASADEAEPPLGRRLTTVLVRTLEQGSVLKGQITTALQPFSDQGLIVGVDVETKGYQVDTMVDW